MGRIVEKKKKKGRPSLLDLQKRSLKQQQQQFRKTTINNNNKTPNSKIQNPSPNFSSAGVRRSTRRNPNPNSDPEDEPPSTGKRREKKKRKLVNLKLPNEDHHDDDDEDDDDENEEELHSDEVRENSGSDDDASPGSNLRKRKIDSISNGSGVPEIHKGEKHSSGVATTKQASTQQESNKLDDGTATPLPDKSLLLFILDRLQKKDTYGVFADPVDPEELPDYHEVIENPMDFSTVRKKLSNGAYANLEQFEKDVFLICSNAMQYNAPDTIYFRQARSIQELAMRNFDNLRVDSDDNEAEPEPKVVRRGRPPTKNLKRPPGRPPLERANSDFAETTVATAGGTTNRSNNEMRKASHLEKYGSTDSFARSFYGSSRVGDACIGWSVERYERADDTTGSASRGLFMKHGKKHIVLDETRRNTYNSYSLACGQEPSVLTAFDRERKQLIAVGLHTEYGYARSLARFAAKIGPVAWKIASKKIERCLPTAVKFGPGWVGESEAPAERPMQQESLASVGQQTPPSSLPAPTVTASAPTQAVADSSGDESAQKPQGEQLSGTHKSCIRSNLNEESSKALSPPTFGIDATSVSSCIMPSTDAPETCASSQSSTMVNILTNGTGSMRQGIPYQIPQISTTQPHINGLNGSYGLNFAAQMGKMIGAGRPTVFNLQSNPSSVTLPRTETQSPQPLATDSNGLGEAKLGNSSKIRPKDGLPNTGSNQKVGSTPPDLNVGFQSPGSPVTGKADSVQPDLALQL